MKLNHNFCGDPMRLLVSHTEGRIYSNIITGIPTCRLFSYVILVAFLVYYPKVGKFLTINVYTAALSNKDNVPIIFPMLTFVEYFESHLRTFKFSSKVVFIDEIQVLLNSFKLEKQLVSIKKSSKVFFLLATSMT